MLKTGSADFFFGGGGTDRQTQKTDRRGERKSKMGERERERAQIHADPKVTLVEFIPITRSHLCELGSPDDENVNKSFSIGLCVAKRLPE